MSSPKTEHILFNGLKHHLGAISHLIASCPVAELPHRLQVLGNSQMDLYFGPLTEPDICLETIHALEAAAITTPIQYITWLQEHQGYRSITLSDGSIWILREGKDSGRYIHLHPGRYAANTIRVKATVLKTAIAGWIYLRNGLIDTIDLTTVNQVRKEVLGLSPVKALEESRHIMKVIDLLQGRRGMKKGN